MLQDYCRRLGIGATAREIRDLAASLKALPPDHPIAPLLRNSPDFADKAGLADALLHPRDRSYSVPQLLGLPRPRRPGVRALGAPGALPALVRRAGVLASPIQAGRTDGRSAIRRHRIVPRDHGPPQRRGLTGRTGRHRVHRSILMARPGSSYAPIRLPDTLTVRDRLPPGAAAVLINRNHTYTDLYLPIDVRQERLLAAIDGERTIAEICREPGDRSSRARLLPAALAMGPGRVQHVASVTQCLTKGLRRSRRIGWSCAPAHPASWGRPGIRVTTCRPSDRKDARRPSGRDALRGVAECPSTSCEWPGGCHGHTPDRA